MLNENKLQQYVHINLILFKWTCIFDTYKSRKKMHQHQRNGLIRVLWWWLEFISTLQIYLHWLWLRKIFILKNLMQLGTQVMTVGIEMRDWVMKHWRSRVFRAWQQAVLGESWKKGGQLSPWAWERSNESKVGKTEEVVVLCGALNVDYIEFGIWRETQVQMSNKLVWSSETNLGLFGKTEWGSSKEVKIRLSPSVFGVRNVNLLLWWQSPYVSP